MKPKAIIFDIDGTLADISHRLHFIRGEGKKDWESFNAACVNDGLKKDVAHLLYFLRDAQNTEYTEEINDLEILFCTGRTEDMRDVTEQWLYKHNLVYSNKWSGYKDFTLHMRPNGDFRKDYIIKQEMLEEIRETHDVLFAVDDRQSVVDMWRRNGVTCFQCEQWDEQAKWPSGELHIMVGPSGAGKSKWIQDQQIWFDDMWLSSDTIREDLCGNRFDQSQNDRVFSLLHARLKVNLNHGVNTIVDATNIRTADRRALLALARPETKITYYVIDRPLEEKIETGGWRNGVIVKGQTLIERHHHIFQSNLRDILNGDGDERVVVKDMRNDL